jgi:hypothetical protein
MKTKNRRRTSYISAKDLPLSNKALKIWGYSKDKKFVCRLEVSAAGVAVFVGEKGKEPNAFLQYLVMKMSR